jgi:hypothetical protein
MREGMVTMYIRVRDGEGDGAGSSSITLTALYQQLCSSLISSLNYKYELSKGLAISCLREIEGTIPKTTDRRREGLTYARTPGVRGRARGEENGNGTKKGAEFGTRW